MDEINKLKKAREKAIFEIKDLPEGKLRCTKSNGCYQYYIDGKYIKREDKSLVSKVGKREYLEHLLPTLEKEIKNLTRAEEYYKKKPVDKCFDSLCEARKELFLPLIDSLSSKIKSFTEQEYDPMPFRETDTSEYYTNNGERVRSKSEKLIADALLNEDIPYKYEMPLGLNDGKKEITFRPDFTVMNKRTGKIIIVEHLGMLDNADYQSSAIRKINIYEKNGYLLGDKLILLHETKQEPLNTKVMKMYIQKFFL